MRVMACPWGPGRRGRGLSGIRGIQWRKVVLSWGESGDAIDKVKIGLGEGVGRSVNFEEEDVYVKIKKVGHKVMQSRLQAVTQCTKSIEHHVHSSPSDAFTPFFGQKEMSSSDPSRRFRPGSSVPDPTTTSTIMNLETARLWA